MSESGPRDTWDATYPAYYQLANLIASIAREHCKVSVDESTLLRWRELMGLMREVDTFADDTSASPSYILDELTTFDRFRDRYPHITPEALGSETHSQLLNRSSRILKLGGYVAFAQSPRRFNILRAAEAAQTANLFSDSATDSVKRQPAFQECFMPILSSLGIAASLLDSAHDAGADYETGKRQLFPSLKSRMSALILSARYTLPCITIGKHQEVRRELFRAAHIRKRRGMYTS